MAYAEFMSTNGWERIPWDSFAVLAILEAFEIRNSVIIKEEDLNGHTVKLKTHSEDLSAIADSGSSMSFPNKKRP